MAITDIMRAATTALAVATVSGALFAGPASAQDAAPAQAPAASGQAAPPAADPNAWVKLCGSDPNTKKQICFTQRELRTDSGQFLASAGIREVNGESRKILLVQTPVGMLIQPGMRVQVDKGKQDAAKYTICFPNACFAELPITDDFISSLKKGSDLVLTTLNQQAKGVSFKISLKGFTSAYDGPAIDTAALQRQQQQLQAELQRKAKEAQQKLIDAQKAAGQPAQSQ
ncbi:invasion associated locus B family protein [Chthonobacter albigriseus]|uniref:invasion associated locus B family protein n=1 Tax=Chthonobacter albigriseus TaxID=1683161 RepID=UPI001FCE4665|nr:invasion associated locus B family protein [Chthonobacter albigriseus]